MAPLSRKIADLCGTVPEIASLRAAIVDINGVWRGKRLPLGYAGKMSEGVRMPLSLCLQDIWGRDIEANPMVQNGDADGVARPTGRDPLAMPWLDPPSVLVPMWLFEEDGRPCLSDPRQALAAVLGRYEALGLTPVVATELEFYLLDGDDNALKPGKSPVTGAAPKAEGVLALDDLDCFEPFLAAVEAACQSANVASEAGISEGGPGQFEINLMHHADALRAADEAVLFKQIVKGVARQFGLRASFMAKPFLAHAGSGFHMHFSILDRDGANIFNDGTDEGAPTLRHAVAGLLGSMSAATLIFAPHLNSYRRLAPNTHAPCQIAWAYDNRFAAVRIPGGPAEARRIEHRVSGADANPYLVVATVLAAALDGIEEAPDCPAPVSGDIYGQDLPRIPNSWERACDLMASTHVPGLSDQLRILFTEGKAQERARFAAQMSTLEVDTYRDSA